MVKQLNGVVVLFGSFLVLAQSAIAQDAYAPYRSELQSVFQTIENNYGPLQLKSQTIGLDWELTKQKFEQRLNLVKNTNEYYFMMADLLNGFNDAHVSITIPSSYTLTLPFQFALAEDKVIVSFIDLETLAKNDAQCSAQVGDEMTAMNGSTLDKIQASSPFFNKNGNDLTNRSLFALSLGKLSQEHGLAVPYFSKGVADAELEFMGLDGSVKSCKVPYKVEGIPLLGKKIESDTLRILGAADQSVTARARMMEMSDEPEIDSSVSEINDEEVKTLDQIKNLSDHFHKMFNTSVSAAGKEMELGQSTPFFKLPKNFKEIKPRFGKKILTSAGMLVGTFKHNGKRVGFIRIPQYMPNDLIMSLLSLRFYFSQLQEKSDYLIIDQTNNPGGAVLFSDFIIRSLVGEYDQTNHMKFMVKPTQSFIREYAEVSKELAELAAKNQDPKSKELSETVNADFGRIFKAYQSGSALSEPVAISSFSEYIEYVLDNELKMIPFKRILSFFAGADLFSHKTYNKPVYFMINELDFSGGDATPATLQDYGRAKLIGVRTAGAGGTVEEFSNSVMNSFDYRLTTSLMYRKGGKLVENYGVQPDIEFKTLRSDYVDGFKSYLPRLMQVIDADLNQQ